jgi:hypothetical protein
MNSRTSPASAVTALPDAFVKARTEVPLITESITVLSGLDWARSRERNVMTLSICLRVFCVTMKLLGVGSC